MRLPVSCWFAALDNHAGPAHVADHPDLGDANTHPASAEVRQKKRGDVLGQCFEQKEVPAGEFGLDPFDNLAQYGWPEPYGLLVNIPFWPLTAGLGLALIAAAVNAGHKLREDTQGLVGCHQRTRSDASTAASTSCWRNAE